VTAWASRWSRENRDGVRQLMSRQGSLNETVRPFVPLLERRQASLGQPASCLRALAAAKQLTAPLHEVVMSCLHMSSNRLMRAASRAEEYLVYDSLARLMRERLARGRSVGRLAAV